MHRYLPQSPKAIAVSLVAIALSSVCFQPTAKALDIVFDFTYDTSNFFGVLGSDQRNALDEAASFFETTFVDDFDAITPGAEGTWTATFLDPSNTSATISATDRTIAADTLLIFVGSQDRGAFNLGEAAPGSYSVTANTQEFLTAVTTRGETGMTRDGVGVNDDTDFGVWGGSVSFNHNAAIDWNFDTSIAPPSGQYDFYSTALHEIAHVFGFGTAESFNIQVNGSNQFTGTNAVAANGGDLVQLTSDLHFANGVTSVVFGGTDAQIPVMAGSATTGTRSLFTELDVSALEDTGFETVPEPGSALLVFGGCAALLLRRRRRKVSTK